MLLMGAIVFITFVYIGTSRHEASGDSFSTAGTDGAGQSDVSEDTPALPNQLLYPNGVRKFVIHDSYM